MVCCFGTKSWLVLLNIPSVDTKMGQAEEDLIGLHRPEGNRNQMSRRFILVVTEELSWRRMVEEAGNDDDG
ncbi:hypothetical protein Hanom_Chr09g00786281 [Helianthus anomalus]